jgi:methionine synthase II (cobalamin-independent)
MGPAVPLEQVAPGLVRCVDVVPEDVPVGLHLCYGDYGHQHFTQPESVRMQVEVVNAVVAGTRRPLNWASFTVPQARDDAGYFAPLRDLAAGPETELYFALVPYHPDDQPEGTTAAQARHIDAALPDGREWGICTECGMGRVAAADVPRLLDLHREILAR